MTDTRPLKKEMLIDPIDLVINDSELDFKKARRIADLKAKELTEKPMLLAWFDKKNWNHSPSIVCGCGAVQVG